MRSFRHRPHVVDSPLPRFVTLHLPVTLPPLVYLHTTTFTQVTLHAPHTICLPHTIVDPTLHLLLRFVGGGVTDSSFPDVTFYGDSGLTHTLLIVTLPFDLLQFTYDPCRYGDTHTSLPFDVLPILHLLIYLIPGVPHYVDC